MKITSRIFATLANKNVFSLAYSDVNSIDSSIRKNISTWSRILVVPIKYILITPVITVSAIKTILYLSILRSQLYSAMTAPKVTEPYHSSETSSPPICVETIIAIKYSATAVFTSILFESKRCVIYSFLTVQRL